jgi:hypothetical protein
MNELVGAAAWLYARLSGDATLQAEVGQRIYADFAPDTDPATGDPPAYPLVVFHEQSTAPDTLGAGAARVLTQPLYCVKVIGEGVGYPALQAAADRIDALLSPVSGQSVTIGGQTYTVGSYRERPLAHAAPENGIRYSYLGGLYRLVIHPA